MSSSATFTTAPGQIGQSESFTLTWTDEGMFTETPSLYVLFYYNGTTPNEISSANNTDINTIVFNVTAQFQEGSYTIAVSNGTNYSVQASSQLIITCYCKGTEILCINNKEEEYIKVEDLKINTFVKTYFLCASILFISNCFY